MKTLKKFNKINELLELKGVYFVEDYLFDYFKEDETNETIFQVISQRSIEDYPLRREEVLDEIIEKLTSYKK